MPQTIMIAYTSCGSAEEARRIAHALVTERLAACVHLRPHEAVYRWLGTVDEGAECGLLAKTTRAAWPALLARIQALHSYDVPAVVAWPATEASAATREWIVAETE